MLSILVPSSFPLVVYCWMEGGLSCPQCSIAFWLALWYSRLFHCGIIYSQLIPTSVKMFPCQRFYCIFFLNERSRVMKYTKYSIQRHFPSFLISLLIWAHYSDEDIILNINAQGLVGVEHASVRLFMLLLLARFSFLKWLFYICT